MKPTVYDVTKVLEDRIENLEQRLRHLLESEYIRTFDSKNYKTGEYKRNIHEIDKLIDRAVKPKRVLFNKYLNQYSCPNCHRLFSKKNSKENKYCSNCGQVLDWSTRNIFLEKKINVREDNAE